MKICLTQGLEAEIDPEDYDKVKDFKWIPQKSGNTHYAQTHFCKSNGTQGTLSLHRLVMSAPPDMQVDHKDGDGLNNKKDNLRLCTSAENGRNRRKQKGTSSNFKGVYWSKRNNKWKAQVYFEGKQHYLGYFKDPTRAGKAYDQKARELFGEFARLNFPIISTTEEQD